MPELEISAGHAAFLQTTTAIVQAIVSISLLSWYILAARLERFRRTSERAEEFASLVKLCRDLGIEAKARTMNCRHAAPVEPAGVTDLDERLTARVTGWKTDMEVIYVCLNEVPHYEVRNPSFSIALTRHWLEVDARAINVANFTCAGEFERFLDEKPACIGWDVDAMAGLLEVDPESGAAGQKPPAALVKRNRNAYPPG